MRWRRSVVEQRETCVQIETTSGSPDLPIPAVTITVPISEYIDFNQKYQYSWDIIVATIGGALQFWIGAGIISAVHLVVFAIEKVSVPLFRLPFASVNGHLPHTC